MTKFLTALAVIVALSAGAVASTAHANPTSGFSINGQGQGNPFGAVNGR